MRYTICKWFKHNYVVDKSAEYSVHCRDVTGYKCTRCDSTAIDTETTILKPW
jgi:hypothetical protein